MVYLGPLQKRMLTLLAEGLCEDEISLAKKINSDKHTVKRSLEQLRSKDLVVKNDSSYSIHPDVKMFTVACPLCGSERNVFDENQIGVICLNPSCKSEGGHPVQIKLNLNRWRAEDIVI